MLKEKSLQARRKILEMIYTSRKSHVGSNLSCVEIMVSLLNTRMTRDLGPNEDRVIVSKGWIAALFFWFLSEKGIISSSDLDKFCIEGEKDYIGLLEPSVHGVFMPGGSVGMGLPFGVGMAKAKKIKDHNGRVFVIEGDGGMQCGMAWESAALAAHHKLNNLCLIVDRNDLQAMGRSSDVLDMGNLVAKLDRFGWIVHSVDGHNLDELESAINYPTEDRPVAIIANTIKGKGISFMEDRLEFHYRPPTDDEYKIAIRELNGL